MHACVYSPSVSAVSFEERCQYLRSLCLACSPFTTLKKGPHRLDSFSNLPHSIVRLLTAANHAQGKIQLHELTWSQHFPPWAVQEPLAGSCPLAHAPSKVLLLRWMSPLPPSHSPWPGLVKPLQDLRAQAPECLQEGTHITMLEWQQTQPKVAKEGRNDAAHTILSEALLAFNCHVGCLLESRQSLRDGHGVVVCVASSSCPHGLHWGGTLCNLTAHC